MWRGPLGRNTPSQRNRSNGASVAGDRPGQISARGVQREQDVAYRGVVQTVVVDLAQKIGRAEVARTAKGEASRQVETGRFMWAAYRIGVWVRAGVREPVLCDGLFVFIVATPDDDGGVVDQARHLVPDWIMPIASTRTASDRNREHRARSRPNQHATWAGTATYPLPPPLPKSRCCSGTGHTQT